MSYGLAGGWNVRMPLLEGGLRCGSVYEGVSASMKVAVWHPALNIVFVFLHRSGISAYVYVTALCTEAAL